MTACTINILLFWTLSIILSIFEQNSSEIGPVSIIRHMEDKVPTWQDPLEEASFDHLALKEVLDRAYILLMLTLIEYMFCLKFLSTSSDRN